MASSLEKRVAKLEGSTGAPGGLGLWAAAEWAEWDLIQDSTAVLNYCSMDQFIVGRAAWVAWDGALKTLRDFGFWRGYIEPDWYNNEVYLSKPGSKEWVATQRAKHPPDWAIADFAAFARWEYSGAGELADHVAIAAAIWLLDMLGLSPDQVICNGLAYIRAWRIKFTELGRVVAPEVMVVDSPTIPVEGFPVGDWEVEPVPVLSLLLACPSGVRADHGRGFYPAVGAGGR